MSLSPAEIAKIERFVNGSRLTNVHIEHDGDHVTIGGAASAAPPSSKPIAVTASAVGTVSGISKSVGDRVAAADHLATLHVLDTETPIRASVAGRITAILTEDGSLASYGAELFLIEPEETA